MRLFEPTFIAVVALGLVSILLVGHTGGGSVARIAAPGFPGLKMAVDLLALAALTLLIHAIVEGMRWQAIPAYLSIVLLAFALFFSVTGSRLSVVSLALFAFGCIAATAALSWILPMFRFSPLTGPYKTGTSVHWMKDESREDHSPSGQRELMVQLWYPAAPSRNPYASYRRAAETTRISSYQSVLKTRSRIDAPLAESERPFPILLFNPAWNGRRTQNTFLVEELASYGFVVAAIDHPGNSEPVAFPDGRVVTAVHVRAMEDVSTSTAEEVQRIGNTEVARQVLDDRFVLDELARWNQQQGSRWYGRLDTEHAGALGHSLGGATSIECWATDVRVRAAMNMDGWTFGAQAATGRRASHAEAVDGPAKPLLFVYEGNYEPFPDAETRRAGAKSEVEQRVDDSDAAHVHDLLQRYGGYCFKLEGADHVNFTDRTITSPLRRLAGGGSIDARRAHAILRECAVSFFSQALLGGSSAGRLSALLDGGQGGYAEVVTCRADGAAAS